MKPVYVMFNIPRNQPGVITGREQKVEGDWLSRAGQGMGAPIPSQIADKLRGRRGDLIALMISERHFGKRLVMIRNCLNNSQEQMR